MKTKTDIFFQSGCHNECFELLIYLKQFCSIVYKFFLNRKINFLFLQAEIIATCQENIQCLETVLRGPSTGGHLLSTVRTQQARGKLSTLLALTNPLQRNENDDDDANDHKKTIIIIHRQCRCSQITVFIARVLDFVIDYTNIFRNFRLYRYFVSVLRKFYMMVGYVGSGLRSITRCKYLF